MHRCIDYTLMLVTDEVILDGRSFEDTVAKAVAGGVTVVQLRHKTASDGEYLRLAERVKVVTDSFGVPLLINDRVHLVTAVGANGVHIGQSDMPYDEARRLLGAEAIIGLSIETDKQLAAAQWLDPDYLGVSPVFCTPTKAELTVAWGLDGVRRIRAATTMPLVAIGGISQANAADVINSGADGLAVVSDICASEDPRRSAAALRTAIHAAQNRT